MKKIKIKPQQHKIAGKELNPIEFYSLNKARILRFVSIIAAVILCFVTLFIIRENKKGNAIEVINQAKDLFSKGKYEASLEVYKQFTKQFPKHKLMPAVFLGEAYCYEQLNRDNEAKEGFLKIQKEFPNSPWTNEAVKGSERLSS